MHHIQVNNLRGNKYDIDIDRFPDECPICHSKVFSQRLTARFPREVDSEEIQIVFQCTNYDCESVFVSTYLRTGNKNAKSGRIVHNYLKSRPRNPIKVEFSEVINQLSNNFCEIYNQAMAAESNSLKQINGIGLRKALEFLIKDYAIHKNPDSEEEILSKPLGKCIENYIDDINVKECAKRAVWLGNDETHYLRKWEDKDIGDLKLLIKLTVNWIENVLLTEKYIDDMNDQPNV